MFRIGRNPTKNQLIIAVSLLAFLGLAFGWPLALDAQEKQVTVMVNDREIAFDVPPFIDQNNRTMVPLRFVLEELGGSVDWNGAERQVTIEQDGRVIHLWIEQSTALVDGAEVQLDTVPVIINGRTLVPLRFISENLGAQVGWDPQNYLAYIYHQPEVTSGSQRQTAVVVLADQNSVLNIRSGPGTNFTVTDKVPSGAVLGVASQVREWLLVHTPNGERGWAFASYLQLRSTPDNSRGDSQPPERDLPEEPDQLDEAGEEAADQLPGEQEPLEQEEQEEQEKQEQLDPHSWLPPGKKGITGVYVNELDGRQVVTIEATEKINYDTLTLYYDTPPKLVIDVENALLAAELIATQIFPMNKEPLMQVRVGQFTPDTARIVLDLTEPVTFTTQTAGNGSIISFELVVPEQVLTGKTIVVDPGHSSVQPGGWLDPGAIGPSGLHEREVVLDIANKLAGILEAEGAKVIMTHTGSTELTLAGRAQVATDSGADIFVSIHANANVNKSIDGTMTFYYNGNNHASASRRLALAIQQELVKKIQRRDLGIDTANFAVLRHGTVPSVLVETAFISNHEEERLLGDPEFRRRAAEGIAAGIKKYFVAY